MRLALSHPWIVARPCTEWVKNDKGEPTLPPCLKFLYDEETGKPVDSRGGGFRPREPNTPPPCRTAKGCPKGTPENPKTLNERNQQAFQYERECQAVRRWPDDAIVRRNAAIIQTVQEEHKRKRQDDFENLLLVTLKTAMLGR